MRFLSNENQGALYAIISGLFYSLVGYFGISLINANLSIFTMLFWRFIISSILISIIIAFKRTINKNPKEMLKVLFYGIAFYGTSSIVYFFSSKYIGTGLSMVIFFIYPAVVMFFNYLIFKRPVTKIYYLSIFIIIIGIICLADIQDLTFNIIGIGLGILSAVCYAGYIVANVAPLMSTLMVSIGCSIICFMFSLFDNSFVIPTTFNVWVNILGFGIISTALPILLLVQGLRYISSEKASILSVLEPVFVITWGIILLDEEINIMQSIGVIIVLTGALITLFSNKLIKEVSTQ